MKERKWDAAAETSHDIVGASLTHEDRKEEVGIIEKNRKSRLTVLRRRIEERLESKRISMEFEDF